MIIAFLGGGAREDNSAEKPAHDRECSRAASSVPRGSAARDQTAPKLVATLLSFLS